MKRRVDAEVSDPRISVSEMLESVHPSAQAAPPNLVRCLLPSVSSDEFYDLYYRYQRMNVP